MKSLITCLLLTLSINLYSHCQVPCGIYGDDERFAIMLEDAATVKKAMDQINAESKNKKPNHNQIVRWVMNKEKHAQNIQDTAAQYFLAQRIKIDGHDYEHNLKALHAIIVTAMKCKQSTDADNASALEKAINEFQLLYEHKH